MVRNLRKLNNLTICTALIFLGLVYAVSSKAQDASPHKRTFDVGGVSFSLIKVDVPDSCIQVKFKPFYSEPLSEEICRGYWIGETEVTQGLYEAVMGSNPSSDKHKGPNNPVNKVSLWDASKFIERISKIAKATFRLPMQVEWVHACRAATLIDPRGPDEDKWSVFHPVATTPDRNAMGIYDMLGNVAEWAKPDKPLKSGYIYYWVLGHHYNSIVGEAGCSEAMKRYSFNRTPIIGLRLAMDD